MRAEKHPESTNVTMKVEVVASILQSRRTENGVNTGILKGGAVFTSRAMHLLKK